MDNNNNFASDLFPLLLGNDKMKTFLTNDINLEGDRFSELTKRFIDFHTQAEKELIDVFEDLPDIPMHNSYNTSNTFGLPLIEKPLNDIENKSNTYKLSAWTEAEHALRKFYQDSLRNEEIPEVYKNISKNQLEQLSELLAELETTNKIQD